MEGHKSACSASAPSLVCRFKGCTLSTKGQGRNLGHSLPCSKYLSWIPASPMWIWQGGWCWNAQKIDYKTLMEKENGSFCIFFGVLVLVNHLLAHFSAKRPSVTSPKILPSRVLSAPSWARTWIGPLPDVLCFKVNQGLRLEKQNQSSFLSRILWSCVRVSSLTSVGETLNDSCCHWHCHLCEAHVEEKSFYTKNGWK